MSRASMSRLARQVRRADESVWVPRAPTPTLHLGVLTGVDIGRNTVSFLANDPALKEIPGVRYLQAYSAANPPQEGDVVRALHFGTAIMILGRHVVPDSAVILG